MEEFIHHKREVCSLRIRKAFREQCMEPARLEFMQQCSKAEAKNMIGEWIKWIKQENTCMAKVHLLGFCNKALLEEFVQNIQVILNVMESVRHKLIKSNVYKQFLHILFLAADSVQLEKLKQIKKNIEKISYNALILAQFFAKESNYQQADNISEKFLRLCKALVQRRQLPLSKEQVQQSLKMVQINLYLLKNDPRLAIFIINALTKRLIQPDNQSISQFLYGCKWLSSLLLGRLTESQSAEVQSDIFRVLSNLSHFHQFCSKSIAKRLNQLLNYCQQIKRRILKTSDLHGPFLLLCSNLAHDNQLTLQVTLFALQVSLEAVNQTQQGRDEAFYFIAAQAGNPMNDSRRIQLFRTFAEEARGENEREIEILVRLREMNLSEI